MRLAVVALLVLALASGARAQTRPDDPLAPLRLDPQMLERAYKKAQGRRNLGIGLAAPGVALAILGAVVIGFGANDRNLLSGGSEIAGGSIISGVGLAVTIPGVTLWILGQDDMDVATWRKKQVESLGR